MSCSALIFGTETGILSGTYSSSAEAMRHETGTATGLQCDCEMVVRMQESISLSSDAMQDDEVIDVTLIGTSFITWLGSRVAILASQETSFEREGFVTDSCNYELANTGTSCSITGTSGDTPGTGCPGWGTDGALQSGTYSRSIETIKHEYVAGDGTPGNPLLEVDGVWQIRTLISASGTYETDQSWTAGNEETITLSSADGTRSASATGIVTSAEYGREREGFATYNYTVESEVGCDT